MARCEASASSIMGVIGTDGVVDKCGVCGQDHARMGLELDSAKEVWLLY